MELFAEWTSDCQGKQDYDAELVSLSTRYWPRGGGFDVLTSDGKWEGNADRPNIRPSAKASIYLQCRRVVEKEFEADTEEEVKQMVEAWAAEQWRTIEAAILGLYAARAAGEGS